jgi:hypothetical protein
MQIFPIETQRLEMRRKEENLTENRTTPMVQVHTKQSVNEENSSLFMNSIL